MAIEPRRITLNEFSGDLTRIIEFALTSGEAILVENEDGGVVAVNPVASVTARKSDEDIAAFLSAAGRWSDVDTKKLKEDIYHSRDISSRPPVSL